MSFVFVDWDDQLHTGVWLSCRRRRHQRGSGCLVRDARCARVSSASWAPTPASGAGVSLWCAANLHHLVPLLQLLGFHRLTSAYIVTTTVRSNSVSAVLPQFTRDPCHAVTAEQQIACTGIKVSKTSKRSRCQRTENTGREVIDQVRRQMETRKRKGQNIGEMNSAKIRAIFWVETNNVCIFHKNFSAAVDWSWSIFHIVATPLSPFKIWQNGDVKFQSMRLTVQWAECLKCKTLDATLTSPRHKLVNFHEKSLRPPY